MSDTALSATGHAPRLPLGKQPYSDERLARLVPRGEERAFATLYERHHQAIYRYCRSILGNDADAQDALQSAMTNAYAALRLRERDLVVRAWLFRIAHNEAISIMRRRRHDGPIPDGLEPADDGIEQVVEDRERLSTLLGDLRELPERQRGALVMRELNGLSIAEIAAALGVSPGAAKQTLFEARTSLHELTEGRAMECEAIRRTLSEQDGRTLRGRKLRAHLRACAGCREFRKLIDTRSADLRALAPPLPIGAASAILGHLLSGGGHATNVVATGSATSAAAGSAGSAAAGSAGSAATGAGTALGGHAAASLLVKGITGVAIVAAATAGTVHLTTADHHHRGQAVTRRATPAGRVTAIIRPGNRAGVTTNGARRSGSVQHNSSLASGPRPRGPGVSGANAPHQGALPGGSGSSAAPLPRRAEPTLARTVGEQPRSTRRPGAGGASTPNSAEHRHTPNPPTRHRQASFHAQRRPVESHRSSPKRSGGAHSKPAHPSPAQGSGTPPAEDHRTTAGGSSGHAQHDNGLTGIETAPRASMNGSGEAPSPTTQRGASSAR